MYVRNVLKSGDYFSAVPIGIPVTLQYSEKGNLEKIFIGFSHEAEYRSDDILSTFRRTSKDKLHIPLPGGTTWVQGVLYTSKEIFKNTAFGLLPQSCLPEMIQDYLEDPNNYSFYAGSVETMATKFHGALAVRQWLASVGFELLPGWLVPADLDRDKFVNMVTKSNDIHFPPAFISAYIIYHIDDVECVDTGIFCTYVKQVNKCYNEYGELYAQLVRDPDNFVKVSYNDVVNYNIQPNSCVILDKYFNVLYSTSLDNKKREKRSNKVACPVCSSMIDVPVNGEVRCPNEKCASRMKSRIKRMLHMLDLPEVTEEQYKSITSGVEDSVSLARVFLFDPYKSMKIEKSISQIVESVIPSEARISKDTIQSFINRCNNNLDSVLYFVDHPDKIPSGLDMTSSRSDTPVQQVMNLVNWLSNKDNSFDIRSMFDVTCITVVASQKRFEGAPIFRGKSMYLTGRFVHGTREDIESILRSYSAEITKDIDSASCVIVGDTKEDINGQILIKARRAQIPVFEESAFFERYEIDQDLSQNL